MAAPQTIYRQRYDTLWPDSPFGPGKSGLTPLSPLHPLMTPTTLKIRNDIEEYQRYALDSSYTTEMLRDLDCITERYLKPNDLTNPIFGSWQKHHWDTEDHFPHSFQVFEMSPEVLQLIGEEGQASKWVAGHPKVWEVLEPCLRLGTRILEGLVDHPWFDAVLLAKREDIPAHRFPCDFKEKYTIDVLQSRYKCINLRDFRERGDGTECRQKFRQLIEDVFNKRISFGLMHNQIAPYNGTRMVPEGDPGGIQGLTLVVPDPYISDIKVWLGYNNLVPLLRNDLSSSERLMETWNVALNMVHETIHAFGKAVSCYEGSEKWIGAEDLMREPYFALEQEAELGRSGEVAIYGGIVEPMIRIRGSETAPNLGFTIGAFPEPTNFHSIHGNPRLMNPPALEFGLVIPIPVTYYENVNSEEYWDVYVKKFGINGALKPPRVIDGIYQKQDPKTKELEWMAITEEDVDLRHALEEFSVRSLSALAPSQRDEHAVAMKRHAIAVFQPMMAVRDDAVRQVLERADALYDEAVGEDAEDYWEFFEPMFDATVELMEHHTQMCLHLARIEIVPGTKVEETRNRIHGFHQRFRDFIETYLPNQNPQAHASFGDIRNKLDLLEAASLSIPPTAAPGSPVNEGVKLITDTMLAYLQGDQEQSQSLCNQASSIIGCPPHIRTGAGFLLAKLDTRLNIFERVASLRLALKGYYSLELGDVPQLQTLLQQLKRESGISLAELEREEKMQAQRISCR